MTMTATMSGATDSRNINGMENEADDSDSNNCMNDNSIDNNKDHNGPGSYHPNGLF